MEPPVAPSHHQKWSVPVQRKQGTKRIFDCAQSATLAWRHQPGMVDFTQTSSFESTFRDDHTQCPTISRLSPGPGDVQTIPTPLSHQPPIRRRLHRDSFARAQKIASPKLLPTVMPVLPRCPTPPSTPLMPASGTDSAVNTLLTRAGSYIRYQPHERTGTPTGRAIACASLQKMPSNVMNLSALNEMANAARKMVADVSKERHSSTWHYRTEFIQDLVTCRLGSSLSSARAS